MSNYKKKKINEEEGSEGRPRSLKTRDVCLRVK